MKLPAFLYLLRPAAPVAKALLEKETMTADDCTSIPRIVAFPGEKSCKNFFAWVRFVNEKVAWSERKAKSWAEPGRLLGRDLDGSLVKPRRKKRWFWAEGLTTP